MDMYLMLTKAAVLTVLERKVFNLWNQYNLCKHVKGKLPAA